MPIMNFRHYLKLSRQYQQFGRRRKVVPRGRRPRLELLEGRTLPSVTLPTVPTWIAEGPAPNSGGNAQGTNMASETGVANSPEDTGAIEAIAVNPGNFKNVFVGAVNGGIWETTDITANPVSWVPMTDQFRALEIASIQFDPTDLGRTAARQHDPGRRGLLGPWK
jgi:hypothetical protein